MGSSRDGHNYKAPRHICSCILHTDFHSCWVNIGHQRTHLLGPADAPKPAAHEASGPTLLVLPSTHCQWLGPPVWEPPVTSRIRLQFDVQSSGLFGVLPDAPSRAVQSLYALCKRAPSCRVHDARITICCPMPFGGIRVAQHVCHDSLVLHRSNQGDALHQISRLSLPVTLSRVVRPPRCTFSKSSEQGVTVILSPTLNCCCACGFSWPS